MKRVFVSTEEISAREVKIISAEEEKANQQRGTESVPIITEEESIGIPISTVEESANQY
jgi:hypothetical protein